MNATRSLPITSRQQLIRRVQRELEKRGYPRLQMMLLVGLTGGAGFLASFLLLIYGVDSLGLRYALSVAIAYLVFLLLLWLWLRTDADTYDGLDEVAVELINAIPGPTARAAASNGGGGQFSGAGSSGRWEDSSSSEPLVELPDVPLPNAGAVADADELAIPLAVVLAVVGVLFVVLFASFSVILSAPVLFAELLVDGVLAASLYRRLRRVDSRHWLQSAVRRTLVPFAITAVLAGALGWGLSVYAPGARTLGDALAVLADENEEF
ncbi:hypothetical protein [Peristeroidobacter agariperforans]|uniref:hypothetical protein n=1 Tax=Peristeroidobacter agariperforans TaxID=268404 RepID=UPI00101D4E2F|nr:hypothetical protein [Peristeroidobacter agariperforans]